MHFAGGKSSGAVSHAARHGHAFAQTELTVEMWIKTTSTRTALFSYQTAAGHIEAGLWDASALEGIVGGNTHKSDVSVTDGKWHHIAWTWSSELGASRIYTDAEIRSVRQDVYAGHNLAQGRSLYIGASPGPDGQPRAEEAFRGDMALVKVWKVARGPMQVFQDMTSAVAESDMVAFFMFEPVSTGMDSSPGTTVSAEDDKADAAKSAAGPYALTMSDNVMSTSEFDWDLKAIKPPATLGTPKAIRLRG